MTLIFDICSVPHLGSKAGHVIVEIFRIINLKDHIPQASRVLFVALAFQGTYAKTVPEKQSLIEGC